jgi:hypothetical protein
LVKLVAATGKKVPKRINAMMKKVALDHRRNRTEGAIL